MGRGRAKAKQVKVARQLKYSGGGTDLDRLRAELGVGTDQRGADGQSGYTDDEYGDEYEDDAGLDDDEFDEDEDEDDDPGGGDPGADGADGPDIRMSRTGGG